MNGNLSLRIDSLSTVLRVKELINQKVDNGELERLASTYGVSKSELIRAATEAAVDMVKYKQKL